MSSAKTGATAHAIVDEVLGAAMTREIWSGNYEKVLPVSIQNFDLTAVLPYFTCFALATVAEKVNF